jgi:hypothetical protein
MDSSEVRERNLRFFYSNPPRLYPNDVNDRPVIESLLAQTAAGDPEGYEHLLDIFNALADTQKVQRFPRVTIVKEEIPAPKLAVPEVGTTVEAKAEESVESFTVTTAIPLQKREDAPELPPKKRKKIVLVPASDSPSA